jgi:hypothetical protein
LRTFFLILCLVTLSGCFSAGDVGQAEVGIRLRNSDPTMQKAACTKTFSCPQIDIGPSFSGRVNYASALVGEYIRLADSASRAEDVAALGIISSAGVGAGALLFDAPANLLKGAGLAAGMIAAGRSYSKPGESAHHLLNAAEGMLCVARASKSASREVQAKDAELVDWAIDRIRLDLRRKLERQAPNYRDIVEAAKTVDASKSAGTWEALSTSEKLSSALDTCVSKAVINGANA